MPGVEAARPLYVRFNLWKHRALPRRRGILVIGMRPRDPVFRAEEIVAVTSLLTRPDRMLLDTRSRPEFGRQSAGEQAEVGGRRLQVAGLYTLGTGFGADGDIIVSDETFVRLFPDRTVEIALFDAEGHAFAGDFLARYLLGDSAIVARYGSIESSCAGR